MDKLAELKKQLLEDEKQNSLSTLNEMISLIPEINGMIAERAKLRDDFYRKNYPGKNIYFAPDNPPGEEYEQFEKKFVEKLSRFKFVFLKANRVLKNKCGIHIRINQQKNAYSCYSRFW